MDLKLLGISVPPQRIERLNRGTQLVDFGTTQDFEGIERILDMAPLKYSYVLVADPNTVRDINLRAYGSPSQQLIFTTGRATGDPLKDEFISTLSYALALEKLRHKTFTQTAAQVLDTFPVTHQELDALIAQLRPDHGGLAEPFVNRRITLYAFMSSCLQQPLVDYRSVSVLPIKQTEDPLFDIIARTLSQT